MIADTYTIPAPRRPAVLWALGFATIAAFVALYWSAWAAFSLVMDSNHALFAAAAIEGAAVVDSFALVYARGRRGAIIPLVFVTAALIVSATYNYAAVESVGRERGTITDTWQLFTLSIGPLVALVGLSINTGIVLRGHEAAVAQWEKDRQEFDNARAAEVNAAAALKQQAESEAAAQARQLAAQEQARRTELSAELERVRVVEAARTERALQRATQLSQRERNATPPASQLGAVANANESQQRNATDASTGARIAIPPQAKPRKGAETKAAIARLRAEYPSARQVDIADALGVNKSTVSNNWS